VAEFDFDKLGDREQTTDDKWQKIDKEILEE
jgi:hypothetical protein